jgi:hypothetical protein
MPEPAQRRRQPGAVLFLAVLLLAAAGSLAAQNGPRPAETSAADSLPEAPLPQPAAAQPSAAQPPLTPGSIARDYLHDQAAIWTAPVHMSGSDWGVAPVLTLATTVTVTADHQIMSEHAPTDKNLRDQASKASDAGVALLGGLPVALFTLGTIRKNAHWSETGRLAGEAMADAFTLNEGVKLMTWRERPTVDGAKGKFFQQSVGWNSSFPSSHAVVAWSAATVMAQESDSFLVKLGLYGTALGVSAARVVASQHFPSDVLVGRSLGWLVGRYVYHRRHHDDYDY